ncbi:ABC transporter ATP-binding protein [Streptomyces sp. NPDC049837]|uniref:ABC transporter ATP-binding protein n=1 Tax=Streptomyces sp. NPDC049837 TaxID=3155277 RepID=UPI0034386687
MNGRPGAILRSALRRRSREHLRLTGWSLVQAVPGFLSGLAVARAVDQGFLAGRPAVGFTWLGVLAVVFVVGAWATRHAVLGLAALVEPFRDEMVTLVTTGTLHRSTELGRPADTAGVARLTEHVEIAREAYGAVVMFVQGFAITVVTVTLGLATLDPAFLVLVLPPLLLGLGLFLAALRAMAARQRAVILANEGISETASAVTGGLRDVVACGAEERVRARTGAEVDAAARATRALARLTALRTAALGIGGRVPLVLILAGAPWLVRNGVTAGAVLGALTYVSQSLNPALQNFIEELGSSGLWLLVTTGRIAEVAPEPSAAAEARPGPSPRPRDSRVELRAVTFGYARSAAPVVQDLDLVLSPGEHLAVVGPSGAGKSTLAALTAGVLAPQAGEVRLGGAPVAALDGDDLARHRVLIPQEAYVFAGTLRENLTYLAPGAAPAEVEAAVRAVGAAPLVERLGGYDVPLDPKRLSAGERQLIALARALLPVPRLTLLDEATCHLDPAAEAVAERAFARAPGTLVVVAHRISSALRAGRVLVMDGTRVRVGTHEELMAGSALYRDLVGHWDAADPSPATAPATSPVTPSRTPALSGSRRSGSAPRLSS